MKISEVKIFRYDLPLKQSFTVHGNEIKSRSGFIVQVKDEDGTAGYGEIAPLPGMSSETMAEAGGEILKVKDLLLNMEVPENIEGLNSRGGILLSDMDLSPAVKFGVEMSLLVLRANKNEVTIAELINSNYEKRVYVNGLLSGSEEIVVGQAETMIEEGFRSIKLKVGSSDLEKDIAKTRAVMNVIKGEATLRLDANQSWDFDGAVRFFTELGDKTIDYVEEPFSDVSKISEFYEKTGIHVALDESLKDIDPERIKSIDGVKAVIIKPTIFGGLGSTWRLIKMLEDPWIKIVISSSFETGLGIAALVNLAAGMPGEIPAGLDTLKWFKNDILRNSLKITNGFLEPEKIHISPEEIDFDLLEEVVS